MAKQELAKEFRPLCLDVGAKSTVSTGRQGGSSALD